MGKYVLDLKLGRAILSIEAGTLLILAGVLSVGFGAAILYSNRTRRRLLVATAMAQFFGTLTLQVGIQAILWGEMDLEMSLRIVYSASILLGIAAALLGWFLYDLLPTALLIGLAAGWDIWYSFSCLVAYDIINTVGGLMLAGIVSFMTVTYLTPLEILGAGYIGSTLTFNGLYSIGMGILALALALNQSYGIFEEYRFYASLVTLSLTLVVFALNAGQHYRSYRIMKEISSHLKINA